jgi:hypothetical protein
MKKLIIIALLVNTISNAQNSKLLPFVSAGSSGVGFGVEFKSYSLYSRYYYIYEDDPTYYVYYHFPSIQLTKKIYSEEIANVYVGLGYSNRTYEQKYFFPGTFNSKNYFISIPFGIEITPFKKRKRFSVILESGIQFEHTSSWKLSYDWQLNLNRGILDIRYKFGKRNK